MPNCPRCKGNFFAMSELKLTGSAFRMMAIHCSACGCIVGMQEYLNAGALIHKLAKALRVDIG